MSSACVQGRIGYSQSQNLCKPISYTLPLQSLARPLRHEKFARTSLSCAVGNPGTSAVCKLDSSDSWCWKVTKKSLQICEDFKLTVNSNFYAWCISYSEDRGSLFLLVYLEGSVLASWSSARPISSWSYRKIQGSSQSSTHIRTYSGITTVWHLFSSRHFPADNGVNTAEYSLSEFVI